MEIEVKRIPTTEKEKVSISCYEVTAVVNDIVNFVKSRQGTISGGLDGKQYEISITDIFYIESVDNKTFVYTQKNVYETKMRLYEVEEILLSKSFVRVSKSIIVNLMKIVSLKPALNGRLLAILSNGEEIIISRKYVPELKKKLHGGNR